MTLEPVVRPRVRFVLDTEVLLADVPVVLAAFWLALHVAKALGL